MRVENHSRGEIYLVEDLHGKYSQGLGQFHILYDPD